MAQSLGLSSLRELWKGLNRSKVVCAAVRLSTRLGLFYQSLGVFRRENIA